MDPAQAGAVEAFKKAWETRDLDVLAKRFAADIEVFSPLLSRPFEGRETVLEVYGALFESLSDLVWISEAAMEHGVIVQSSALAGRRRVDFIDVMTLDSAGTITKLEVYIRPLSGLGDFAAAAGPAMGRRRSRLRAVILRTLGPGLRAFTSATDWLAGRLVN